MHEPGTVAVGVPQPDRVAPSQPGVPSSPPAQNKQIDLCMLARWNRELPFAELPNMMLEFLASDNVSGVAAYDKSK